MRNSFCVRAFLCLITLNVFVALALSQQPQSQEDKHGTIEGTVVSTSRQTMVVKTDDSDFHLFVFDRYTTRPKTVAVGSRVRVVSKPGDEEGTRLASSISVLEASQGSTNPPNTTGSPTETRAAAPPPAVRDLESSIKSEARRWHLGVRAGAALDPELFMFGVHSQIGPIVNRNVFFRPNAEFAFGEVTDLIALNLEAIYRLPVNARGKTWSAYVGAGPALTFIHQNFEREQGQGRNIDFGNFDYETGFNILTGIQRRHTFFEIKTSLYSRPAPTLRLIVGYTF